MITFNFKSSITLLFLGLIIGFCLSFLFNGCGNETAVAHEKIIQPKDLKKESDKKEASYQAKISELENKNVQLQQELKSTKEQLLKIKSKIKQRESNIKKLIEPKGYPAKELLQKVKSAIIVDTSLSPCDSLVQEVSEYMQENEIKDSLYESQISKQDSMMAGKDSVIEVKTQLHRDLQLFFDQSLQQQQTLIKENTQLRKQFKRQKVKSKLISLGVLVLSGLTANYIINH
jgi:hypothetical protein